MPMWPPLSCLSPRDHDGSTAGAGRPHYPWPGAALFLLPSLPLRPLVPDGKPPSTVLLGLKPSRALRCWEHQPGSEGTGRGHCRPVPCLATGMWLCPSQAISPVQEAEGPVVNGEPHDAHVVRVEDAVAEADALPLGHHPGCATCHLQQSRPVRSLRPPAPLFARSLARAVPWGFRPSTPPSRPAHSRAGHWEA